MAFTHDGAGYGIGAVMLLAIVILVGISVSGRVYKEKHMSHESRRLAGILLIIFPTVIYGGTSLLSLLINDPAYQQNPLRQALWTAGHAHAGVLLILALVALRYVDEARLAPPFKLFARYATPVAAILLPVAFFLSVLSANATEPNGLIYLAYVGAVVLGAGLLTLGVGLLRRPVTDQKVVNEPASAPQRHRAEHI